MYISNYETCKRRSALACIVCKCYQTKIIKKHLFLDIKLSFLSSLPSVPPVTSEACDQSANPSQQPIGITMEKMLNMRNRTSITKEQTNILQNVFEVNCFPDIDVKRQLQRVTGLSTRVIQVWFQNRRREQKYKKKLSEVSSAKF